VVMHLRGDPKEDDVWCVSTYLQADGTLGETAVSQTPDDWGTLHVYGEEIIPLSTYYVRAEWQGEPSADGSAVTWAWGDIDNDELVNLADIMGIIGGYQGDFTSATIENLDQRSDSCDTDGLISLADIMAAVQAYQGVPWHTNCPVPCGSE